MRKLILIGLALVMLSCRAFDGFEPSFTMGMAESDFKKKNKPELVAANEDDGTRIYSTYTLGRITNFSFFEMKNLSGLKKEFMPTIISHLDIEITKDL